MDKGTVVKNLSELAHGIETCMGQELRRPALVLLYAAIDITAWLACDDPKTKVVDRYTAWLERYFLPAGTFHCNATDLYGARCGMVHTFTSESTLRDAGKARRLLYAWGGKSAEALQRLVVNRQTEDRYVAVCIEDLYAAWRSGLTRFLEELDNDHSRAAGVYARAALFFDEDSTETIDRLIEALPPEQSSSRDGAGA